MPTETNSPPAGESVAVLGHSGFVGTAVVRALTQDGYSPIGLSKLQVSRLSSSESSVDYAHRWIEGHGQEGFDDLVRAIRGCKAVVNAAGLATSGSSDLQQLRAVNAALPIVLGRAAQVAGVNHYLHISSAAVQGNAIELDESRELRPFSPYSTSKAEAEEGLWQERNNLPQRLTIYRPTSVMGPDRNITLLLAKLFGLPVSLRLSPGDRPLPLALVTNVAQAVSHMVSSTSPDRVVLHPWEGITQQSLTDIFARPGSHELRLPVPRFVGALVEQLARKPNPLQGRVRQVDLLLNGQRQQAQALPAMGFELSDQTKNYLLLAEAVSSRVNSSGADN